MPSIAISDLDHMRGAVFFDGPEFIPRTVVALGSSDDEGLIPG